MTQTDHTDPKTRRNTAKTQIAAFATGAIVMCVGLVITFFMFIGPSTTNVDPTAAWCRGWVDGLSYTDFRSGKTYDDTTLDGAETKCHEQSKAGQRPPGSRGPITVDSPSADS